ncbi:capsular polysaccharide transport system permease protein [Acinetobacter calcoaceticus]|uniref:Transport permease protein n=1 Tax=Acinetobacter calcoaceticus TaxID=471 RepID=A0A4V2R1F6_ACICA|nr:capsular polysaccharide transport system permease protein [Acinetobacter calcoaceticus]
MAVSIRALFLREIQTRFGQYRLGYLWIILEPLFTIGLLLVLFGAIMQRTLPNISYEVFLLNGIVAFRMFRSGLAQSLGAAQANKGLFSYRPVKPIDALIARNILEFFLSFTAYIFFSAVFLWLGLEISFEAIPTLLGYWLLLFLFMLSFSLIFIVLGDLSSELSKLMSVIFLILYFLSGVMYSVHIIPAQYREYFLYNPLIHIFEPMRHAVAPAYPLVDGISLSYVLTWIGLSLLLGLLLYKRFERRMIKSK